jgi:hypothetical protein
MKILLAKKLVNIIFLYRLKTVCEIETYVVTAVCRSLVYLACYHHPFFVSSSCAFFFRIDEHITLLSLLEKHLCPGPWKDQLTQYRNTELRDLKLFIQKSAKVL